MLAFASDFDGTLYFGWEEGIRVHDQKSIRRFQKQGHLFGLCTGRPLVGIDDMMYDKVDPDFYILTSGAVILDRQQKIIYEQVIDKHVVQKICETLCQDYMICIQANLKAYTFNQNSTEHYQIKIKSVSDIEGDHIYGISFHAYSEENAQKVVADIQKQFGDEVNAFYNVQYVDIVKKGCSKGAALHILKDHLHLQTMCGIGDSYNDIPMLESVDKAFTFHHSPTIVQSHATHLVDSISEAIDIIEKEF